MRSQCFRRSLISGLKSILSYRKLDFRLLLKRRSKALILFITIFFAGAGSNLYALDLTDVDNFLYSQKKLKKISMDFENAEISNVLKALSQQSGLNFIASDEVSGIRFNLYLDDVPVRDALEYILTANNLRYELKEGSNIFVVKKDDFNEELISRVYPLKYATVSSSKLKSAIDPEEGQSSMGGEGEGPSSGIVSAIKSILTERGSIVEDARTNSLIVIDEPKSFPAIEQTIARLDVRISQILIEVEMLDISKNTADLLGAKFGDTPVTFSGAEKDSIFPFNEDNKKDDGFSFEKAQYRVSTLSFAGLAFTLQFLRTQSDTKNLARPRILTLNNETAEISVKTDEAIGISTNTTSSEGTSNSSIEAERVETGVFLKVTPQINMGTKEITMVVEPKVIEARTGQTFSGQTFKDPEERGTKAILRVKDGDTIIMGGLLRNNVSDTRTKIPVLGDLPVLGKAFRHKKKIESQRELVIFITPHIVEEEKIAHNLNPTRLQKIVREQGSPSERLEVINQALSSVEKQRY